MRFVTVDFKEMNEWMNEINLGVLSQSTVLDVLD